MSRSNRRANGQRGSLERAMTQLLGRQDVHDVKATKYPRREGHENVLTDFQARGRQARRPGGAHTVTPLAKLSQGQPQHRAQQ